VEQRNKKVSVLWNTLYSSRVGLQQRVGARRWPNNRERLWTASALHAAAADRLVGWLVGRTLEQASKSLRVSAWIDTVNYLSACLSAGLRPSVLVRPSVRPAPFASSFHRAVLHSQRLAPTNCVTRAFYCARRYNSRRRSRNYTRYPPSQRASGDIDGHRRR